MNRLLRFSFGAGMFVALLCASGCATDVQIDPTGYKCDPGDVCPDGFTCVSGTCRQDGNLCAGVSCVQPPASTCVSGTTLRTFAAVGTCAPATGTCDYAPTDVSCPGGCANGACQGDNLCDNVTCNAPPASTCSGNTLVTFASNGQCDSASGQCTYASMMTACPGGCSNGACIAPNAKTFKQIGPRLLSAITPWNIFFCPSVSGSFS